MVMLSEPHKGSEDYYFLLKVAMIFQVLKIISGDNEIMPGMAITCQAIINNW